MVALSIFGSQITGAQNRGELAEAVEALVVHLDDNDAFESGEDFFEAVRQRMDVAQMQRAGFLAMFAREFHRVVDRPVSGTPADEQRATILIAIDLGQRNFLGELAQFVAALRRHGHVQLRAAGRMAHFVVFEAGRRADISRRSSARRAGHVA